MNYEVSSSTHYSVPVKLARDGRLSFRARGIAMRLLSNAPGFRMSATDLARESPQEGRYAVLSAMRELRELGYAKLERTQDARGRWRSITRIFGEPQPKYSDCTPVAEVQSPNSGGPGFGERASGGPGSGYCTSKSSSSKKSSRRRTTTGIGESKLDWTARGLESLDSHDRSRVGELLSDLGHESQQDVLDELAAWIEEAKVSSPIGLLARLVDRARTGSFNLSRGRRIQRTRDKTRRGAQMNPLRTPDYETPFTNSINWAFQQFNLDGNAQLLRSRLEGASNTWPDEAVARFGPAPMLRIESLILETSASSHSIDSGGKASVEPPHKEQLGRPARP